MDNTRLNQFRARLRHRLRHFLWDERSRKAARASAIRKLLSHGWRCCLFGGVVRDIAVKSPWYPTRDIDIVVDGVSIDELAREFADSVVRQTRFGGLTLLINNWQFDVWPLERTWGSRFFPLFARSFAVLPKTTFFSVEAIAVELPTKSGVPRLVHQERFLDSVTNRVIYLNLPDNPYPELCIVRAFALAQKLDFGLAPELVQHLATLARRASLRGLEKAMISHYGKPIFAREELGAMVRRLRDHADSENRETPFRATLGQQMVFPFDAAEPLDSLLIDPDEIAQLPVC